MELAPTYAKSATKPNSFEIYHYRPQGRRTIGRPKKRWREQLQLWRRNGSKGPILDVYDDDDDDEIYYDTRPYERQIIVLNLEGTVRG